ncbi:MAG: sigma-54-dependent Fis family transcriptional regulator [Deltaproteobacteria bacterium]|nr:sigma-54-dependent Fis family transcriptional regulator [Deltaproteobacteria bacterium]MBW1961168.1 sigma-54-dependent Fis family transcriptional regulator [Deltaproteobacteria bacterium]MBW1994356.1 sigma-54-dependent Fis family transcriptional regulator [Deltaproteobacteria bacterium]MBW2150268.1 sigma-54-dependent Fis family transcriptional regulator [Deltaproteobacteria bacterium]
MDNSETSFKLLLVDDEPGVLSSLRRIFLDDNYDLYMAKNGQEALSKAENSPFDAALIDLKMPGMDGITLLAKLKRMIPGIKTMIITGHGRIEDAVRAMQEGAEDFIEKPFTPAAIRKRVHQFYRIWALEAENRMLKEDLVFRFGAYQLVGQSSAMQTLKEQLLKAAPSDEPVLILGETGTGKELVARAIHQYSRRSTRPFVPVDCASISETVIESELFGHVKGAFTGAHIASIGLIRSADRGTLFLDEIGELSLTMQGKLLRTLQEREVRPVGSVKTFPVDIRIVAATNRNLKQDVIDKRFRNDLYFRLNVIVLKVPPLRDRREDIPLIVRYFIKRFRSEHSHAKEISRKALECLQAFDWPGNVRELENTIRSAMAMASGDLITPEDLPPYISGKAQGTSSRAPAPTDDSLASYEKMALVNALAKSNGNRKHAARILGIGEATLYRKIKRYGLGN